MGRFDVAAKVSVLSGIKQIDLHMVDCRANPDACSAREVCVIPQAGAMSCEPSVWQYAFQGNCATRSGKQGMDCQVADIACHIDDWMDANSDGTCTSGNTRYDTCDFHALTGEFRCARQLPS